MITDFLLPDLGEGLTEAEVVQWLVAPGDPVTLNQTLAEVETAKAVVELPSPYEGTVATLHAEAGETVAVGAPLIAFDVVGAEPSAAPAEEKAQPNLVGYGAAPAASGRPARRARRAGGHTRVDAAVLEAAPHDAAPLTEPVSVVTERPRSTPPVRAHAKRLGVDLVLVAAELGERPVTRADVNAYAERVGVAAPSASATPPVVALTDGARETRVPVRGVRKHTAAAMVQSAFTAPHVTVFHTLDVTSTMELIAELRADRSLAEHRIGLLAVVAKAVCVALTRTPGLNARWDEASGDIVQHHFVDLGIAAATERGLIVPNIREADSMSLVQLADALRALTDTARAGKTGPSELAGGTFSITNIGVFGVDAGTPILPPGQSGILAMGAVRKQPWEYRGEIALREVMTLSLSFDHRIVDGAEGAQFLRDVASVLESPGRAMVLR